MAPRQALEVSTRTVSPVMDNGERQVLGLFATESPSVYMVNDRRSLPYLPPPHPQGYHYHHIEALQHERRAAAAQVDDADEPQEIIIATATPKISLKNDKREARDFHHEMVLIEV